MKLIIIAVACVALGFGVAYLILPAWPTGASTVTMSDGQLYTCGMHPEVISSEPGVCPICNMRLIPKRNTGTVDGTIRIDPVMKQNMGLVTAVAKYENLSRMIHAFGEVSVPDPNVYVVTLKFDGWIEHLFVAEEGERVFRGQPLFEVYSPELVTAQKELLVALKSESSGTMTRLAEAARSRLRNWDISQDQIEQLVETGEVKRTLIIRSPADGFVQTKHVSEGDRVSAQSVLYEIADLSEVWIEANVYEQDLTYVALGQPAKVSLPGLSGKIYVGQVSYVSPLLDERNQVEVRLRLSNPDFMLKPVMYAEVTLENTLEGERLVIPRSAVINSGARQLVYVATNDESYEPRLVVTGAIGENDLVEVTDGLKSGESVVTSGQFLLDSETRLSEATGVSGAHMHHTSKQGEHQNHGDHSAHEMKVNDPYNIYTCPMPSHSDVLNYGPGECPECGMDLVPVAETDNAPIYVCPMPECAVATKEPGVCPKCNMHLIKYEPEVSHD